MEVFWPVAILARINFQKPMIQMANTHIRLPKDNVKNPEEAIAKIRFDTRENIYFFKHGKQVLRYRGEVNQISIVNSDLAGIDDCILVHNHPQGTSFSESDIENAIRYNVKEFILATHEYVYYLKKPTSGWNIEWNNELTKAQMEESRTLAENLINKMIAQNEMPIYDADIEIIHYIWASFFRFNDVSYTRKRY